MRRKIRLYRQYVSIVVRGMMQYKASFLLNSLGQFLVSFSVFLGIYFMFRRFHQVRGYSYSEVLLCYAIVLMEFSLAEMWARGFDTFSGLVRSGEFDRVLVRPQGEILQVLGSRFELTRLGRMSQAVVMLVYAFCTAEIHWTVGRVCTFLFMLVGGTAVFSGLFLIYAALCFFTLEGLEFMNVLTDGAREYGKYPLDSCNPVFLCPDNGGLAVCPTPKVRPVRQPAE
ncbi:MAG: hypothetical protein HFH81_11015 [Lachnospiraceae bacterium]|nr:hypothetical protein [Lachnospiraceae bacterium]